ncbi:MAG: hypothetical protein ACFFEK_12650, partial [Candidatus Thorarchaeota archaeon]
LNQTIVEEGAVGFESVAFNPITIDSGVFSSLVTQMRNNDNITHHLYLDIVVSDTSNFITYWHGDEVTPIVNPGANQTFTMDIGDVGAGDFYGTTPLVTAYLPDGIVLAQYLVQVILRTEDGIVDQINLLLTVT